jgi:hypothetical protein
MFTDRLRYSWELFLVLTAILAVSGGFGGSQSKQQVAPRASTASYDEMVRRLKDGDLSIDFAELRMQYAASPRYEPEEGSDEVKDMYSKLNAKDYEGALKTANAVLSKQYVNIDAHLVASAAYEGLHDDARAKLHHDIVVGLARSILDSGSGASTATAYKVISVGEEYALMRVLGLRPGKQSCLHEGKRSYDEMDMVNPKDNSTVTRYFDVTLSDEHMEKALRQ